MNALCFPPLTGHRAHPLFGLAPVALALAGALAGTCSASATEVRVHTPGGSVSVSGTSGHALAETLVQAGPGTHERREIRLSLAGAGDGGRLVKGAPYCADALTESTQWLFDPGNPGQPNRITSKSSTRICRDGEGRTRQEVDLGGRKQVMLRDPAARETWVLDPERKTAIKGGGMRIFISGGEGRPPLPPGVPPVPGQSGGGPGGAAGPEGQARRHVETQVFRIGGSGRAEAFAPSVSDQPIPNEVLRRALSLAPRGPGVSSPLPERDFEGLKAHGERTTWTVEAGKLGNEKPIVQTREVWTSPELMLTLYSKDTDPRQGETVYRLQNLKRGEPDAGLFKVPEGYQVIERPGPRGPQGPGGVPVPPGVPQPGAAGRG